VPLSRSPHDLLFEELYMRQQAPWFVEERAVAFASLMLTSNDGVAVKRSAGRDTGIDLLAEVLKNGKPTLRFFGVQLVADLDLPPRAEADKHVLSHLGRDPFEAALPLCVFVIGVREPNGIYRWVVEPVVEDGRAELRRGAEGSWETLDKAGAARLIDRVTVWYDARHQDSGPRKNGRTAKPRS
jgi:hypothetical protein